MTFAASISKLTFFSYNMYQSCISEIAANVAINCNQPQVGGYTGRAVLIPYSANPVLTQDSQNPRIINGIAIDESAHVVMVDNVMPNPFDGSNKQSNAENGRPIFTKTFAFRIPLRGAVMSKEIVEPLMNSALGYMCVAEKQDKSGHGSFEVIGALQPLKTNGDGIGQNEGENDGDITVTMSCSEMWYEAELYAATVAQGSNGYAESKVLFEELIAKAF